MKKRLILLVALTMILTLVACGGDTSDTDTNGEANTETKEVVEEDTQSEETEEVVEDEIYFKDNEVKIEDLKIKITDTKVIPVGEAGNEYGENPVFAIWYETTNLTDDDINPTTAWMVVFTAIQDNDPNAINELNVGSLPDENHLDSQLETIKKDGTVENSVAYELDDLETPVTLVATQGLMGDEIGRQDYDIK